MSRQRVQHGLVRALEEVPSLGALDDGALLALAGDSANLFWRAGSAVFRRGSPADGLYVVVTGRVRILDGDDGEVALLGPGEFFGEFSLLLGTAHQFDAVAVEDCELLVVPKERVDELLAANADVAASIRATLDERMAANAARAAPST